MSTNHVIWRSYAGSKYCGLGGLLGVPDQYQIKRGISRANGFPPDARFEMNKRFAKQVALPDSVVNLEGMAVVSTGLKDHLAARAPPATELLPVRIINHKGRDSGAAYWIVSPLSIVDCIDQGASQLDWNVIDPTLISGCLKLVFDPATIPPDILLFRPRYLENVTVLARSLADSIVAAGFTGLRFGEVDEYVE